jgi:two-component system, NarL family, response regulator DegU
LPDTPNANHDCVMKTPAEHAIRLLIADDHSVVRDGLKLTLTLSGDFHVIAEASDGDAALHMALSTPADALLLDVHLPNRNGIDVLRAIREINVSLPILLMTGAADATTMQRALALGANGLFAKSQGANELRAALFSVMRGERYVSESLQSDASTEMLAKLTPRECDVLRQLASGASSKQIADRLNLSINTVHKHRENLTAKLGLRGGAELVSQAVRLGFGV